MTTPIPCVRCGESKDPLPKAPLPGPQGAEIAAKICSDCWQEWEQMEVMVINELRLNFMDPEAQEVLSKHMLEFLQLSPPESAS